MSWRRSSPFFTINLWGSGWREVGWTLLIHNHIGICTNISVCWSFQVDTKFGLLFLTASLYISLALVFPASTYIINHYTQCNQSVNCNHFGLCKGIIVLLENLCSCNNFISIFWLSTALWLPALSNCNGLSFHIYGSCLAPTSLEMASKSISVVTWSNKLSYT